MECDLDCFEEDQEHIHVRNAGIIDELGHITCFFSLPLTSSHILSDKTGTITKNNLKAVSVCTTTREIPINNEYLSSGAMALDDDAHRLLLNMITNHSALSIATEVADLPPFSSSISLQQSSRPKTMLSLPSSSFSEIRIVSASEEWRSQSRSSYSSAEDMQVFCSSQDERVALSPFFHRVGDSGRVSDFGYCFCNRSRTRPTIDVEIRGIHEGIEVLQWFPFTTERKRTTVVVRYRDVIWLFCKVGASRRNETQGADSTVFPLLSPDSPGVKRVTQYVEQCAQRALRT